MLVEWRDARPGVIVRFHEDVIHVELQRGLLLVIDQLGPGGLGIKAIRPASGAGIPGARGECSET